MVGIDGVAQAEAVSEKRCSQQNRITVEGNAGPEPCRDVEREQDGINGDDPAAKIASSVVEQITSVWAAVVISQ